MDKTNNKQTHIISYQSAFYYKLKNTYQYKYYKFVWYSGSWGIT